MALLVLARQLLLIALLSWNVYCYPPKTDWRQHHPSEGSYSNIEASSGLDYSSSQSPPAWTSGASYPGFSFPVRDEVYSNPETSSVSPDGSNMASWNTAPAWEPAERATATYTESRSSQPTSEFGIPPPFYQGGELSNYEANLEHGNSEMETEEMSSGPPPYPDHGFQAGELSSYTSVFEHGNEDQESEEQGYRPPPPYGLAPHGAEAAPVASTSEGYEMSVSQEMGPSFYHLFLTGQLPPGTYSHFNSDHENGMDHWDEVHYERYHYPMVQQETTQTKVLPNDQSWKEPPFIKS